MLIVYSAITWLPLSLVALVVASWGFLIVANLAGTLLQTLLPEEVRGRVTGLYSLVLFGSLPIGGLAAGVLAQRLGLQATIALGAAASLLIAAILYVSAPQLRSAE